MTNTPIGLVVNIIAKGRKGASIRVEDVLNMLFVNVRETLGCRFKSHTRHSQTQPTRTYQIYEEDYLNNHTP